MRKLITFLCLVLNTVVASSQTLGGNVIMDYLVSGIHPNGCSSDFITGLPNDSTWVNFSTGEVMTGDFGSTWSDVAGDELLLETSYHPDNYNVRLLLTTGLYSTSYAVQAVDWVQISGVDWIHIFNTCTVGMFGSDRYILPLDFNLHFGLNSSDIVAGIEITFLETTGSADLSGVYIISSQPCNVDLGIDATLCPEESLILDATITNGTYLWQDNSTNPTYNVTQQGIYWVEVTDSCGTASDTININYNPVLTVDLGDDKTLCHGYSILLDTKTTGGTYLWQDNSTDPTYNVTQQGTYWVEVMDSCGTSTDTININYIPFSAVDLGSDVNLCQGESLVLDATAVNSTYLWQDNSTDPTYNVTQQGTYWVVVTDSCGSSTDIVNVNYNQFSITGLGTDTTLCQGESILLDVTIANGVYLWHDNSTNPTYNITEQGTYWVEVMDSCGSSTDTININYNHLSTFDLGNDISLCQGGSLTLDGTTANSTYLWQDDSTNPTYNVTQQGTYWVEVMNNCGSSFDTININYNQFSTVDLGADITLCDEESLILDATTANSTYLWQDNSTNSSFIVTQQGTYWVVVSDSCGSTSDTIIIDNSLFSSIDLGIDTTICEGESLILDATTINATYLWQDNSTSPTYNVTQQGTYWVAVSDCFGSTNLDTIFIGLENCDCNLYLPNIFSPNSDNINNELLPLSNCGFSEYNFKVFDRWGELIFETNVPEESWDGSYQGQMLQTGVYIYMVVYTYNDTNNFKKIQYGDVTLIR